MDNQITVKIKPTSYFSLLVLILPLFAIYLILKNYIFIVIDILSYFNESPIVYTITLLFISAIFIPFLLCFCYIVALPIKNLPKKIILDNNYLTINTILYSKSIELSSIHRILKKRQNRSISLYYYSIVYNRKKHFDFYPQYYEDLDNLVTELSTLTTIEIFQQPSLFKGFK